VDFDYKPVRDLLLYAKYARGYRTGGVTLQAPTQFQTYQPEKVNTYETGLKTSFSGPVRGTFDFAGFYNDFKNQQLSLGFTPKVPGTVPNATGIANAGASTIYGAEIDASILPFERFTVDFGYTYLHTHLDKISLPAISSASPYLVDPSQAPLPGDELAFSPKNKYTITATYELPLPQSLGRISVGPTFTHTDPQIAQYVTRDAAGQVTGDSILRSRDLLDLNLNWNGIAGSSFDLSLFANNVTGQQYYTYVLNLGSLAGFETAQLGNPRFYGARVRYNFGK
jgi:iron complex outermembrane receptor protein